MNAKFVNLEQFRRIAVIGTSCSGKTTFASTLARLMRVKHIELDAIHWLPHRTRRPHDEFRRLVEEAVAADQWVLDGNYSRTRDLVWSRATSLIWLNYPLHVVAYRALGRTTQRVFDEQILYSGNRETFRQAFLSQDSILLWVLKTYYRRRREYSRLLQEYQDQQVQIYVFRAPAEADRFLAAMSRLSSIWRICSPLGRRLALRWHSRRRRIPRRCTGYSEPWQVWDC
jgi:adenylate kinase family enzyme